MQIPMLDLKRQYEYMKKDIDAAIRRCLAQQEWILGPELKKFEERVTEYLGVRHCIGVSSGTDALVLCLRTLAIKLKGQEYFDRDDRIITTPFTFTATGDAILRAGATPLFVDIDPATYNIDVNKIRDRLISASNNVVGIIPVHFYGQACKMDKVLQVAKKYDLFLVEDVAQAFGGKWKERKLGSIGDMGAFSFFPSKNLGGFGDGGMIVTNDSGLARIAGMLRKHGGEHKGDVSHIGYNARLDTLQAAVLLMKMKYIDEFNDKRRKIAEIYNKGLETIRGIAVPKSLQEAYHVYHQYTIRVLNGRRDELQKYLGKNGIGTRVYYPVPLHKMEVFKGRCEILESLKEADKASKEVLSLPIDPLLTKKELEKVVSSIAIKMKT